MIAQRYLRTVPDDLSGFASFLHILGVREKYGIEDFLKALIDMSQDYSGKILPSVILLIFIRFGIFI